MFAAELAADARVLWRLLRGQPRTGSHAERLVGFYAPQADRYDAFRARLLHGRDDLIAALDVRPGQRVVELGCGTGRNLDALARACAIDTLNSVHLVDLCAPLLQVARERARTHANVEVIEADATEWRPEQPADRVFLSYSLTMMPDWQAVLANAEAMLAPSGRLGIVDFHLPASGNPVGNVFWRAWFSHDGVHLSSQHLSTLKFQFAAILAAERRAAVPYLPFIQAPYYLFVGEKRPY